MSEAKNNEFVTVATFPEPASAQVARTALEAAGIPVFLQGENANGLIPVAFDARLLVRASDEAVARRLLEAEELTPATLEEVTQAEIEGEHLADVNRVE